MGRVSTIQSDSWEQRLMIVAASIIKRNRIDTGSSCMYIQQGRGAEGRGVRQQLPKFAGYCRSV